MQLQLAHLRNHRIIINQVSHRSSYVRLMLWLKQVGCTLWTWFVFCDTHLYHIRFVTLYLYPSFSYTSASYINPTLISGLWLRGRRTCALLVTCNHPTNFFLLRVSTICPPPKFKLHVGLQNIRVKSNGLSKTLCQIQHQFVW